jgi:RNA-splicing ligase RtcB
MFEIRGKYTVAAVFADLVEPSCVAQITQMVSSPSFTEHVAIMPDCHAGKGSVVGFTMPLGVALPPAVVGVDIGCGMLAARVPWGAGRSLEALDRDIRARVPFGHEVRERPAIDLEKGDPAFFRETAVRFHQMLMGLRRRGLLAEDVGMPIPTMALFRRLCRDADMDLGRALCSIGTLGGGNHFIEIGHGADPEQAWVVVHSGSRQLGEWVCKGHQRVAARQRWVFREGEYQEAIERIRATTPRPQIQGAIAAYKAAQAARVRAPAGLEPLHGAELAAYLFDMVFAQAYAALNREHILADVCAAIGADPIDPMHTVHNYIDPEDLVIRKGAVRAHAGDQVLIPFNRSEGSWLCRGLGNPDWNRSAPHGAGRRMSRSEAKRTLDAVAEAATMAGIYTSCDPLDEAPGAYKDAASIQAQLGATVEVVEVIRPILNLKAA